MRNETVVLGLALMLCSASYGQFVPGFCPIPHGGFGYSGRAYSTFGMPRSWSGYSARTITQVVVLPSSPLPRFEIPGPNRLAEFTRRLPQVPPVEELDVIRGPVLPPLPPLNLAAFLGEPAAKNRNEESERLEHRGRSAFAEGEYGLAAEQLRQAVQSDPKRARCRFLLGQAEFATGHYREAVVVIVAGLRIDPKWPDSKFDPRNLYVRRPMDHSNELERLRRAFERQPHDPALAFLLGYQLWFMHRRAEAVDSFERARPLVEDPAPIDRFLDVARRKRAD